MDTLERELQRTLRSVHVDRTPPADLGTRLRQRQASRRLRHGGVVVASIVVVVALLASGGVLLGDLTRSAPEPAGPAKPAKLSWKDGRITVGGKIDARSVIGFVDDTHVVVSSYEGGGSIRKQVVDLTTGEATKFLDLPGRVQLAEYDDRLTDGVYLWVDRGTIQAVNIRSGRRWDVGRLVPKPQYMGTLTDEEARDSFKPVQFTAGSGYVVWRDYAKGAEKVLAAPVEGGEPRQIPGIADHEELVIDAGRLAAYDGRRVKVFDLATGKLVAQRPFARVKGTNDLLPATCGVQYCVRGKKARGAASHTEGEIVGSGKYAAYDGVVPEVMRISDGTWIAVPGAPVLTKVIGRDSKGRRSSEGSPPRPQIVGRWLRFGTGTEAPPKETAYLFDIPGAKLHEIGKGQLHLTADGHAGRIPSLGYDLPEDEMSSDVDLRYLTLPR